MGNEITEANLLAIVLFGLLTTLAGNLLSLFRDFIAGNLRYLLLVPPLEVAAYFSAVNMYRHYDGSLPDRLAITVREISFSTRASTGIRLFSRLCMGRSPVLLTD